MPGVIADMNNNLTEISVGNAGDYTFTWNIENGTCKISDEVNITLSGIEIPEGFSPNQDGINDTFVITGLDFPAQNGDLTAEFKIVNGAGAEVFSTTNRNGEMWKDWDGKNSNGLDLPDGTYYYLLKTINSKGHVDKYKGFIILKRY